VTIDVNQFSTRLAEVRNRLQAGETVELTLGGAPLGVVAPARPAPADGSLPRFGCAAGSFFWMAPDFDEPLSDEFWDGTGPV
jgi:antitoxin (DNA-binding transcriptional repressor) of toxin-antitoxin stability system